MNDGTVAAFGASDQGGAGMPEPLGQSSTADIQRIFANSAGRRTDLTYPFVYACPAGHAGSSFEQCSACVAGRYAPVENMHECLPCPEGTFSNINEDTISNVRASELSIPNLVVQDIDQSAARTRARSGRGVSAYYAARVPNDRRSYSSVWDDAPAGKFCTSFCALSACVEFY